MNYNEYYLKQIGGGGYNVYKGKRLQRGYGIGGVFRKLFSTIMPVIKNNALPVIKRGAKAVGSEILSQAPALVNDVLSGKNVKESVNQKVNNVVNNLGNRAEKSLKNSINRNKKIIILKKGKKKKNKKLDIFS